ncbi:MAG: YtcA family lipoprotein [Candidatus Igneacidithiobacillus chanchocoensis]
MRKSIGLFYFFGCTLFLIRPGYAWAASPSIPIHGAYFASWIFCMVIGIVVAILIRALFIRLGIDDGIPLRVFVYAALALLVAFSLSITIFGR